MRNILVVGNGFDLYHGLKTGYRDFIRCVEEAFARSREERTDVQTRLTELCNRNGFFRHFHFSMSDDESWSYFESEMDNIVRALSHFQSVMEENQKNPEHDPAAYNIIGGLFSYNDLLIFKDFTRIFEQIYDDPSGGLFKLRQQFITAEKRLDARAMVREVRKELESFTEAVDLYLSSCVGNRSDREESDVSVRSLQIEEVHPDYVINFNFTNTPVIYGIPEERIFYAKGKAGNEPLNLVLGSPDLSEEPEDWIYLKNYFQKLMKFIGLPDREQLYSENEEGKAVPVTLHYFGYSFPEGDAELICELNEAAEKTVVYYTDQEDYAFKIIRLIRLFGKDAVTEKIYGGTLVFRKIS
ncbi:MAG: bacteriophage abortive infection AbiH family protein [Clostridiales bacterium]|nr:bacteriophage abortive infection AbiH family protein [Clostridiales bacterium]